MNKKAQAQLLKTAIQASHIGSKIIVRYFRKLKNVSLKEGAGLVSEADRESETAIRDFVRKKYPGHSFLGEEWGYSKSDQRTNDNALWYVDPLDGTTNYVHGFPFFCVSIGVEVDGVLEVGVVNAPLLGWIFSAAKGKGAFLNGQKISVSKTTRIEDSLLATGFSYLKKRILQKEITDFRSFAETARGVRRAGSAALDLCMVANGIFDGYWERALSPWDTAAGVVIVKEAGGRVTNFSGREFRVQDPSIVAANKVMIKKITQVLKHHK